MDVLSNAPPPLGFSAKPRGGSARRPLGRGLASAAALAASVALSARAARADEPRGAPAEWLLAIYVRGECATCLRALEGFSDHAERRFGAHLAAVELRTFDLDDPDIASEAAQLLDQIPLPTDPQTLIFASGRFGDELTVVVGGVELLDRLLDELGDVVAAQARARPQPSAAEGQRPAGAATADAQRSFAASGSSEGEGEGEAPAAARDAAALPTWFLVAALALLALIAALLAALLWRSRART